MNQNYGTIDRGVGRGRRKRGPAGILANVGPLVYFPIMFVYLEVAFHLYMGMNLKYFPIYLFFGISAGCVCTLLIINFKERVNRIICYIVTVLVSILFCAEIICKKVLAQYYQIFSTAGTAANNNLTDYMDAIIEGILKNLLGLLLMLLPVIFIFTAGRMFFRFKRKYIGMSGIVLGLAIVTHLLGLLMVQLPWKGDLAPKELYASDTNVDDQVEQLGMVNMLRLDVKHTLFGTGSKIGDDDFEDIQNVLNNQQPSTEAETGETEAEEPVDTSPNVMDIDFDSLIANAPNDDTKWMSQYFQSVTPSNKNKYTGMFEGYNVIFITAEGFTGYMIDEELTPTLYKLTHEGFVFNNFYTPLHYTSTSGGEFQNLTGMYPKNGNPISMKESGIQKTNLYFSLAPQLNRLGYNSIGFHANVDMYGRLASHTNLGYNWIQDGTGFEMEKTSAGKNVWPQSDLYMMEQSIDQYINSGTPFNVYYMTISGHMPYNFSGDMMALRNQEEVSNLPYSETTKAYIAANLELEKALTYLIERLEEAGIADKTVIAMAPDHIPYSDVDVVEELAGKTFGGEGVDMLDESALQDFDLYKNTLIIWSASMEEPVVVDKVCGQVDILPTLSNLLGLEYDSRMLAGTDILSDSSPLVIFTSRSWKTDKGFYNRYTEEFTLADGVTMTEEEKTEYVDAMKKVVRYKLQASELLITTDYYDYVFN